MKLLYLTLDNPLDIQAVATGNQVRVQGIREVLEAAGHEVQQLSYLADPTVSADVNLSSSYHSVEELEDCIRNTHFDVIIVAYWSLLEHLPACLFENHTKNTIPIVLDFIAPRVLELMFQAPETVPAETQKLVSVLYRVDHVLVGNQRQFDLLLPLLIQSGIDCRLKAPISIVPISARSLYQAAEKDSSPVQLINAGVDWPWRKFQKYRQVILELLAKMDGFKFNEFSGTYPGDKNNKNDGKDESDSTNEEGQQQEHLALLSYEKMQATLAHCHIGLELGERNTEREFSHSFRAIEYLECGLPIVINSWIPLARQIKKYNAGWVIDSPEQIAEVLTEVLSNPQILMSKQAGVEKLKAAELNYKKACEPLLAFLADPVYAGRITKQFQAQINQPIESVSVREDAVIPETANADDSEPGASTTKIILASLFKKFLCPARADSNPDILMVTRADLFPVDHGAAVKIIRTAEALSRQGRDLWLTTDSRKEYYQFSAGEMITHRFPLLIRLMCLPRTLAFMGLIRKGYPVSNSFLYLPVTDLSYIVRTVYLASRKPIGAYQAEFPAYVRPCRYARSLFGGKILLVQHNVEYDRIKNQVPDLSTRNIETLKNIEVAMCHIADNIVAVSDNDRQKMMRDGIPGEKIHTIPHGVDLQAFRTTPASNIKAVYGLPANHWVLVYHGTYSYSPNLESMAVMANEILPRLQQRGLMVSVLAIGSKPPDFPLHQDIHFAGSVKELAEVIPAADLAVVPLQDGGGTRMKILDYFAAGVPVISTTKGIEGIPVEHGREALIIDDFDEMCDAIERLLNNPDEASKLSSAASEFVDSLSWDAIARKYLPLLQ